MERALVLAAAGAITVLAGVAARSASRRSAAPEPMDFKERLERLI